MTDSKNNHDPWRRREEPAPPDLFKLIKQFFLGKSGRNKAHNSNQFGKFIGLGLCALFVIWALSGIFLVSPAEQAVVTRFGRYSATLGPGPHWIPRLFESEQTINVQRVNDFSYQADMLTRDENIVSVSIAIQYRIARPVAYLFNVVNPITTLQQTTSSALRQVIGQMSLDTILTTGREKVRNNVAKLLRHIMEQYRIGLEVTDVTLQPAQPPEAVTHAFDDAIKAREDEQRYINKSEAYARRIESSIKGHIARIKQSALAYQQSVILHAKGATKRYLALLKPYTQSPIVTRERLYLDALSNVLSRTTNIVMDSSGNNVLYLPLEQVLKHQKHFNLQSAHPTSLNFSKLDEPDLERPSYNSGEDK